jgi:spore coat protein U-like protein
MKRITILAALLSFAPVTAWADCTVNIGAPVNFGTYLVFSGSAATSTGYVAVDCNSYSGTYVIALSAGVNGSGSFSDRLMSNGTSNLPYQLFADAGYSTIWGDGTGGSVTVSGNCSGSCNTSYTVYSQIPALQAVSPGSYSDTVQVTVTY